MKIIILKKNITNNITNNITKNTKNHNYDASMNIVKKQDNRDTRRYFITTYTDFIYIKRIDSDFQSQLNDLDARVTALEA